MVFNYIPVAPDVYPHNKHLLPLLLNMIMWVWVWRLQIKLDIFFSPRFLGTFSLSHLQQGKSLHVMLARPG